MSIEAVALGVSLVIALCAIVYSSFDMLDMLKKAH